ncbi:MAG: hypothetical protein DRG27_04680 [Deltaproteobacteria bacterium]|nr:MAG: hypothetical protein DRG27_04680 [Deltaproteobacteria bacterium]
MQIIKEGDVIKIKLTSAAQKGKANKQLLELLSKRLKLPKSKIKIVSGESSRDKRISIEGLSKEEILSRLI